MSNTQIHLNGARLVFGQLVYVYFIGFLALLYIANAHFAERQMRMVEKAKIELKELRWNYLSATSGLKYSSTASYIESRVRPEGLKPNDKFLVRINPKK